MIRFIFCTAILVLAGCTYNQDKHFHELFTKERGALPKERDAWIVEQSIGHPSTEFTLSLEPQDSFILLKGNGIPLEERLIFAIIDTTTGKIDPQFEFEAQPEGDLKVFDQKGVHFKKEIPFVACEGLVVGKPIVYALVSKDNYTISSVEFIPYPLEVKMESGAEISLVVTHSMHTRFQLSAQGFHPHERVELIHESGSQREEIVMFANEEGKFSFGVNPTVIGRLGGEAKITVHRESEDFVLEYPWGAKLESRTLHKRTPFSFLFVVN